MRPYALELAKDGAFKLHLHEARLATQERYGTYHKELLAQLAFDSLDRGGLKGMQSVYHVGYLHTHEAGLKQATHAGDYPCPLMSTMGGYLDKKSSKWDYKAMQTRFETGELLLVESRPGGLVSDVFVVHLPTLVANLEDVVKKHKNVEDPLLPFARNAAKDIRRVGGKRLRVDSSTTPSPEASPERAAKRPRLSPAARSEEVEVLMQSDAMELDPHGVAGPQASFAEKFTKILNPEISDEVAAAQITVDAAWTDEISQILFERLPSIVTITAALMQHKTQLDEVIKSATYAVEATKLHADKDFANAEQKVAQVTDPDARFHYYARLVEAHKSIRTDMEKQKRIVQDYQAAHPLIAAQVANFFERSTPAAPQEQNKLLAAAYHLTRTKKQLPAALLATLPLCVEPGCTKLVHPHFGESCCKHLCLVHRTPEHAGHVAYHGPLREAAAACGPPEEHMVIRETPAAPREAAQREAPPSLAEREDALAQQPWAAREEAAPEEAIDQEWLHDDDFDPVLQLASFDPMSMLNLEN